MPRQTDPAATALVEKKMPDPLLAALAGVAFLIVLLLLRPFAGVPMNDDFSYARNAAKLAETGRMGYNNWGQPLLIPQALAGALIIKAAGFSYTALELFGAVCGAVTVALFFLLARACDVSRATSFWLTVTLTLNPIFLGVAPTFMTETPSLVLYLGGLLALVAALRRPAPGETARLSLAPAPFAVAVLLLTTVGANRQLFWGSGLAAMLAVAPFLDRRAVMGRLLPGMAVLLAVAGALMLWERGQPNTLVLRLSSGIDYLLNQQPLLSVNWAFRMLSVLGLFLLPVSLATLLSRGRPLRLLLLVAVLILCLAVPLALWGPLGFGEMYRITIFGQYFTDTGVMVGGVEGYEARPTVLPSPVPGILSLLGAVGMALSFYLLIDWLEDAASAARKGVSGDGADGGLATSPPDARTAAALTALAAASAAQVVFSFSWYLSGNAFDRYHLLTLPGLLILHAWQAERALSAPAAPMAGLRRGLIAGGALLFALAGVAFADQYFRETHARATLYRGLLARGVPPERIDAGIELNADLQIAREGRINHRETRTPGTYDPSRKGDTAYVPDYTPVIRQADYRLSMLRPHPGAGEVVEPEPVETLTYRSLLAPNPRAMYVYRVLPRADGDPETARAP